MMYQAMELLEGADLGKVMAEGRAFTWDAEARHHGAGLRGPAVRARAIAWCIAISSPPTCSWKIPAACVVLDFGMVRVAESELTKVGSSVGTVNYMAPEQIRGERCTAASDVFSAGIVFFQLATGRHPFSSQGPQPGAGGQRDRVRGAAEALGACARRAGRARVPVESRAGERSGETIAECRGIEAARWRFAA